MYRLGPCIPISGFFLLLKVQRGCVYVIILFLVLVLFKIYVFIWKKGIGKLLHQIAQKHTAGGGRGGGGRGEDYRANIFGIWLYLHIMSRTRFRVNPQSLVAWMSRNSLLEAGSKSEVYQITYQYSAFDCISLSCHVRVSEWIHVTW